jgi:hypothetical protein
MIVSKAIEPQIKAVILFLSQFNVIDTEYECLGCQNACTAATAPVVSV